MRAATVVEHANSLVRIEALWCHPAPFGNRSRDRIACSRPLNHFAPWLGARSTTQRYSSSRSASAFLVNSTRYAMFAPEPVEHLPRGLRTSSLHVSEPSLNALDGFDAFEQLLVGFSILDDDFGLAVNRQ